MKTTFRTEALIEEGQVCGASKTLEQRFEHAMAAACPAFRKCGRMTFESLALDDVRCSVRFHFDEAPYEIEYAVLVDELGTRAELQHDFRNVVTIIAMDFLSLQLRLAARVAYEVAFSPKTLLMPNEWLLDGILPPVRAFEIVGDLREQFARKAGKGGICAASLWHLRATASVIGTEFTTRIIGAFILLATTFWDSAREFVLHLRDPDTTKWVGSRVRSIVASWIIRARSRFLFGIPRFIIVTLPKFLLVVVPVFVLRGFIDGIQERRRRALRERDLQREFGRANKGELVGDKPTQHRARISKN